MLPAWGPGGNVAHDELLFQQLAPLTIGSANPVPAEISGEEPSSRRKASSRPTNAIKASRS
jgi:hypothetical protein